MDRAHLCGRIAKLGEGDGPAMDVRREGGARQPHRPSLPVPRLAQVCAAVRGLGAEV